MNTYNYNFNKKAKETFTAEELEKLREYCRAVRPRQIIEHGETYILYNDISAVDFLGEELSEKLKKFYEEEEQNKIQLD